MKAISSILSAFLTLACVAMLALPAMATTVASEIYPAAAYDSRAGVNQHLLVYLVDGEVSSPYTRSGSHIAGQFVDSLSGAAIGDPFPITEASAAFETFPDGAMPDVAFVQTLTGGVYCVVWAEDLRNTDAQVYAQLVDADTGALIGSNRMVSSSDNLETKVFAAVAANNQGSDASRFMVAWSELNPVSGGYDITGALMTADGSVDTPVAVSDAAGDQSWPDVAYDSINERYLVVFKSYQSSRYRIHGQYMEDGGGSALAPMGTSTSANFAISDSTGDCEAPAVAYDGYTQKFAVVWEDARNNSETMYDIYGQVVVSTTRQMANDLAICQNPYWQDLPSLDSGDLGGVGIVWHDYRFNPTGGSKNPTGSIFGRALSLADYSLSPEREVAIALPEGDAGHPVISSAGLDGSLIAYPAGSSPSSIEWVNMGTSQLTETPDDFLIARWAMNEGAGATANDSTPNGYDGNINKAQWAVDKDGAQGRALYFDGASYVSVPNSSSFNNAISSAVTLAGWIKLDTDQNSYQPMIAKTVSGNQAFWLGTYYGSPKFRISTGGSTWDGEIYADSIYLTPQKWYHLAGTYDGETMNLYLNGSLVGSYSLSGTVYASSASLTLGAADGMFLEGALDDVRVYGKALNYIDIAETAGLDALIRGFVFQNNPQTQSEDPLSGVAIEAVSNKDGAFYTAVSDANGYYNLFVPTGCYELTMNPVGASPYIPFQAADYAEPAGAHEGGSIYDYDLTPGGPVNGGVFTITGGIQDYYSNPAGGVVFYRNDDLNIYYEVQTQDGVYTLTNLPGGEGVIGVRPWDDELGAQAMTVDISADSVVTFTLTGGVPVFGTVSDEDGYPLEGVAVTYYAPYQPLTLTEYTDENGEFNILGAPDSGPGYVIASPDPDTRYCGSGRQYVSYDNLHGGMAAGLIRLQKGVMVSGNVYDAATGDLTSGVNVEAGGLSMHSQGRTCGGAYSLVIPEGTHAIYSGGFFYDNAELAWWPYTEHPESLIAGNPVTVTVSAADVMSRTMVVSAPDMYVTLIDDGGALEVTVVDENSSWAGSGGEFVCAAYVPGTLSGTFDPNVTVQNPVSTMVLTPTMGAPTYMAPFPLGQSYDLYLAWVQSDGYGGTTTTILDRAFNVPITPTSAITFTLPAACNSVAYGEVTAGYTTYSGALVYLTDVNGDIAGWGTSGMSGFMFYNVPVGADYTVTAYAPEDGATDSNTGYEATEGGADNFGYLELTKTATPALALIETHRVNADGDVFDGSRTSGGDYHYQVRNSVWFEPPYGVLLNVDDISASLEPGRSTENVMASEDVMNDGMWATYNYIPENNDNVCGPQCTEICSNPVYNWGGEHSSIYFNSDMSDGLEYSMVDSAQSTWAGGIVVTRTADVTSGAGNFVQVVTVSAKVTDGTPGDVYTGTLQLRVYNTDHILGNADVRDWTPGVDENGYDVDDGFNSAWGFAYYNIENPIIGHEYSYSKYVDVSVNGNVANDVFYMPRTRVRLTEYLGAPNYSVDQYGIYLSESGTLGDMHLMSNATPMEFLPGYLRKLHRREVQHEMKIGEIGATRPELTASYPQNGDMGIASTAVISMTIDKPGMWGGYFLNVVDQWGNLIADTDLGPYPYNVSFVDSVSQNDTMNFAPDGGFAPGTAYGVTAMLRDSTYYRMPTITDKDLINFWFATAPEPGDVTPPEVVSTRPYDGETGVPTMITDKMDSYQIVVSFSEAVKYMSTELTTMYVLDGPGGSSLGTIPITSKWMGHRFAIFPNGELADNTWYRIELFKGNATTGIQDLSSNLIDANYVFEFSTGDYDAQGPVLSMPLDGATDVAVKNPSIVLYADKELDPSTLILGTTLHLYAGDEDISSLFEVQYLKARQGVQFFLNAENQFTVLPNDTVITLIVDTELPDAVTDAAGNAPVGGTASQSFSFRTVPTFGNSMPSFYNILTRVGPQYPQVYNTVNGYYVNASANIADDGYDNLTYGANRKLESSVDPMYGRVITMTIGDFSAAMEGYTESYWNYQTWAYDMPPGANLIPGDYDLEITAYDTACHSATLTQPVRVYQFLPGLESPADGSLVVAPVTVEWSPINGEAAGYYIQFSHNSFASWFASYFIPEDGRTGNYTFTIPEDADLGGVGATVQWRVIAVASLDQPFSPLGGSIAPMQEFTLGEDSDPPWLSDSSPYGGETGVEPTAGIYLTIMDDVSGVDVSTLDVQLNSISLTGLTVDDSNPNEVYVSYTPETPWYAEDYHTLKVYCQDYQGQNIDPYPTVITFTVRANRGEADPIMVPTDFATVQDALDSATYGDHILVENGSYSESLSLTGRHTGITLTGSGYQKTTLQGPGTAPVINVENSSEIIIRDMTITNGTYGIKVNNADIVDIINCRIAGNTTDGVNITGSSYYDLTNNLIYGNLNWGVYLHSTVGMKAGSPLEAELLNNTIADNYQGGIYAYSSSVYAYYNIVADNTGNGVYDDVADFYWDYNLVYGNGVNYTDVTPGANDVNEDPLFVDTGNLAVLDNDYHLQNGSPAMDMIPNAAPGSEPPPAAPGEDLDENIRPQFNPGGDYDAGCYEMTDDSAPFIEWAVPGNGDTGASPAGPWHLELKDYGSGIDETTLYVGVNSGYLVADVVTSSTVTGSLLVDIYPQSSAGLEESVCIDVTVSDKAGNSMNQASYCFTTRGNTGLYVNPGDSISEILQTAVSGDVVYVNPGEYVDNLVAPYIQSGVVLTSTGGPEVTKITSAWALTQVTTGEGTTFVNAPVGPVVSIEDVDSFTISGFTLESGSDIVQVHSDADNVLISGNVISGCVGHVGGGGAIMWLSGSGIDLTSEGNCRIENNLIMHNGWGITVEDNNTENPYDPVIVNNTVVSNSVSGVYVVDGAPDIFYNIIAYNRNYGLEVDDGAVNDYNCLYSNTAGNSIGVTLGANTIQDDPLFIDPAHNDYQVEGYSPCVDAFDESEASASPEAPNVDILGVSRPQGQGYDLGCYEKTDGNPPYLLWAVPDDGDMDANPSGPWRFELDDNESGVNPLSVTVQVDYGDIPGVLNASETLSGTVLCSWTPDSPLDANHNVNFKIWAYDYTGNQFHTTLYFRTRGPITITVPTDYPTIQEGLDAAASGDTVQVLAGTYTENLEITSAHSGVALVGAGADQTIIQGEWVDFDGLLRPAGPTIDIMDADGFSVEYFTLTDGAYGVFIDVDADNIVISKNIISANYNDNVLIYAGSSNIRIENNLVQFAARGSGIAIEDYNTSDGLTPAPKIVNNTVVSNTLHGISADDAAPTFFYNISAENGSYGFYYGSSVVTRAYNCAWDNGTNFPTILGTGEIEEDPLFTDSANGDYTLLPDSPAIDAIPRNVAEGGTVTAPDMDLLERPRPLGPNSDYDMGCYEEYGLTITSTPPDSVLEGGQYTYQPAVYGDVVSWAFGPDDQRPNGMTIDPLDGEIAYTAGDDDAGTYTVQIAATDVHGRTTYQTFTLTVTAVSNGPGAPVAVLDPPYYAMINRTFDLEFTASNPESATLEYSMVSGPAGMDFPDVYTPELEWTPTQGQTGVYPFQVQVSDGTTTVQGDNLTVTVLDPLKASPAKASPLILVTGAVTTTVAVNCRIEGGLAPYSVDVGNPDYGTIINLDAQAGTFTFMPLDKGKTSLWVYDSAGFSLTAGPYDVQKMQVELAADPQYAPAGQGVDMGVNDPQSDIYGMGFSVPGSSTSAPVTFTIGTINSGAPYLAEGSSSVVQIGPDGTTFAIPATLQFPYTGDGDINSQLVFTFNPETGRWEYVPDEGNDGSFITVNLQHLSLYTLAEPSENELDLEGGTTVDAYRMVSFPLYPAAESSIVDLLGDDANLGAYDDTLWRIFAFDPLDQASGDANEYYIEGNEADFDRQFPMEPGQAYWLISRNGGTVTVPGLKMETSQDYYTTLQAGWNMIGNPYDHYVNWSVTLASTDGEDYYYPTSTNSPLYGKDLFTYDPDNAAAGDDGYVVVTQMDPNGGYWIHNPAGMPISFRIPHYALDNVKSAAVSKTESSFLASVKRKISRAIQGQAWAGDEDERPPKAPGTSGANAGSSSDSIGVAEGDGGGGGCFVDAASNSGAALPLWLLMATGLLAAALLRRRNA
ncbi:parallel beta-helix repeat (two copies) [Desulfatibacillum alkenivorans DSM 16219]|uniref:Parallel beta-helix repeat (Two copies) n=1 Tax=Desulfatibacillum alkenivorans DSM 16219 TaxID=1121393 RepID=A0A1M6CIW6_9BACT|nr:right-handed parallel beta-helix repeat-containing protein [Desulfatibacillum alkenivorans]SHI60937.1 parallel beta-helix repeat (two copies) [Desulfatibacillum alkenivorans DSM 16219]